MRVLKSWLLHKPIVGTLASTALIQGVNVVTGVILARSLGPHLRGELAAVILWPLVLAMLASLGLSEAVSHYVAKGEFPVGTIMGTVTILAICESFIAIAIGLFVIPRALAALGSASVLTSQLYLSVIPLYILGSCFLSILNGLHRFSAFQILRVGFAVLPAVVFVALVSTGNLTIVNVTVAYFCAYLAQMIVAFIAIRLQTPSRLTFDALGGRKLLSFGLRGHTGSIFNLLNERLDQLVISVLMAPAKLGLYVTAVSMTSLTATVGSAIGYISLPTLSRATTLAEKQEMARRFLQITIGISVLVSVPLWIAIPYLIKVLFGPAFLGASTPARFLVAGTVMLGVARMLSQTLKGLGKPLTAGSTDGIAVIFTLVGLPLLIPRFGLLGAATTSVVAYSAAAVWSTLRVSRIVELSVPRLLLPSADEIRSLVGRIKAHARSES